MTVIGRRHGGVASHRGDQFFNLFHGALQARVTVHGFLPDLIDQAVDLGH